MPLVRASSFIPHEGERTVKHFNMLAAIEGEVPEVVRLSHGGSLSSEGSILSFDYFSRRPAKLQEIDVIVDVSDGWDGLHSESNGRHTESGCS